MKFPVCREPDLIMADRQGIEIDYCPQCRGVWLDRGELDKVIERSAAQASSEPFGSERSGGRESRPYPSAQRHGDDAYHEGKPRRKRGGLLGELFDFG